MVASGDAEENIRWDEVELSYPVLSSTRLWQGAVFGLREDTVQLPSWPEPVVRQYLDHGGAVGIVALRGGPGAEEVLLQMQYRHPAASRLWEIPAGLLDVPGEDPLEAAKRELREEADLEAGSWQILVDLFTSPGASSEQLRIFLATDLTHVDEPFPRGEEEATMVPRWALLSSAVTAVLSGEIHSPSAVAGILAVQAHLANKALQLRGPNASWFGSNTR